MFSRGQGAGSLQDLMTTAANAVTALCTSGQEVQSESSHTWHKIPTAAKALTALSTEHRARPGGTVSRQAGSAPCMDAKLYIIPKAKKQERGLDAYTNPIVVIIQTPKKTHLV